ncbi:MAG: xanthine dehydrogenase family protein molybdopterin-binding subunit [Candidatus Acidiferrales bacterium]
MLQPKLVGARVRRVEDPRFLLGRARYIDDIVLPRMLHMAFLRSIEAHADVVSVDTAAVRTVEGVQHVITGADLLGRVTPIVCDSLHQSWQGTEFHALASERVRFVGEGIAAVVADDRYIAEDAAELVEVDLRPRQVVASMEDAMSEGAPLLHDGWRDNYFVRRQFSTGDVQGAFAGAEGVLNLTLISHRSTGMPLETRGCIADYDPSTGILTLWTSTQIPHLIRTGLADCLGIAENQIRVVGPDMGGGFGIKGHLFPEEVVACVAAIDLGRPVKWIEDRREHLLASIHAREHTHHLQVAYAKDGTLLGLKAKIFVDCGAYSVYPWTASMDAGMALGVLPGPYQIQNYECEAYGLATNKAPLGPYRGVGRPAACFSIERAMDSIARALEMDPIEVRRRNLVRADQFPYTTATGLVYDSGSFIESLDKVSELADYEGLRRLQSEAREKGRLLGIGVACFTEQTAHATTEFIKRFVPIIFGYDTATVRMDPSGRVTVQVSTHSHGQGHETTMAQIVADQLTVPLEDVRVMFGDTASAPYGMGTFASRSIVLGGGAAHLASGELARMLLKFGAHVLEVDPQDAEITAGRVSVKGAPSRDVSIRELARWAYHRPEKLPEGMQPVLEVTSSYDAPPGTGTFANSAQIALVEVDPATGRVQILRYVVVEDCGTIVNPTIVEGQVHGGIAQGIGGALLEELVYSPDGQLLTTTLMDYLMPSATEIPAIEVSHIQTPSPFTIGGMKGMGEGGAIAPPAVIAGAVEDALRSVNKDVFVNEVPLTLERVRSFASPHDGPSSQ